MFACQFSTTLTFCFLQVGVAFERFWVRKNFWQHLAHTSPTPPRQHRGNTRQQSVLIFFRALGGSDWKTVKYEMIATKFSTTINIFFFWNFFFSKICFGIFFENFFWKFFSLFFTKGKKISKKISENFFSKKKIIFLQRVEPRVGKLQSKKWSPQDRHKNY